MAEIILGSVADSISSHLLSLISMGTGPVRAPGVRGELEKIQKALLPISALLHDTEKRLVESDHRDVRHWFERLQDVIYDADDLVDDVLTEALHQSRIQGSRLMKEVRIFFSSSNQLVYGSRMAHRVEGVGRRLRMIQHDGLSSNPLTSHCKEVLKDGMRPESTTVPSFDEQEIVGRESGWQKILGPLLHRYYEENVAVLAIVGTGGVGKTTTAKLVLNNKDVEEYFDVRLWVCVTTDYDLESLVAAMLLQCTSERRSRYSAMDESRRLLRENLHAKRVLLVLDDVWEEDGSKWLELRKLVDGAGKGSKILVTTRSPNAARAANAEPIYELNVLTGYDSLCLLMREAGKTEDDEEYEALAAIGEEIVRKCGGLPYLITCAAHKLRSSANTVEDWSRFSDLDSSKLAGGDDSIMHILRLRYSNLPSDLKRCFAYCSLFPKHYRFDSLELINLWMSQGYIKSLDNRRTPEEVGYGYLMGLISGSFFTEIEKDADGKVVTCKMDLSMHHLAKYVVGNQCFTLDESNDRVPETSLHVSTYQIHLDLMKVGRMSKLRTFLLLDDRPGRHWNSDVWGTCMSRFKKLRALRLRGVTDLRSIPKSIAKLRHLRHLDLSKNEDLQVLPNSISKLHNLETLNLEGCRLLRELPHGISKLASMRHLYMTGCDFSHMPRGLEKLTCLQTLCPFVVAKKRQANAATLSELSGLNGLKDLAIRHLEREVLPESVAFYLRNSSDLRSLELRWEDASGVIDRASHEAVLERLQPHKSLKRFIVRGYGGDRFPAWGLQLENLVWLEILDCLHCKHLPSLDHLPNLKYISLENMRDLEYIELSGITESSYSLPLRIVLKNLPEFKGWEKRRDNKDEVDAQEEWDLKILSIHDWKKLEIHGCPKLSFLDPRILSVWGLTDKILKKLVMRIDSEGNGLVERIPLQQNAITSIRSVSLNELEYFEISNLVNVEYLPEELFKSLPALHSLVVKRCVCLKALNGWKMLRYLSALTKLEISMCPKLDLSAENGDEDRRYLQQQEVQRKLSHLSIHNTPKMKNLPGVIQALPNLGELSIRHCNAFKALPQFVSSLTSLRALRIHFCEGLKSLPGRLILHLSVTSLESLEITECLQLDFSEEEDREFSGPSKLRRLEICGCEKMQSLPWWIQFLPNLEDLSIRHCKVLRALPQFMNSLTSLRALRVHFCDGLNSLPGRVILQLSVNSLVSLEITECPRLDFSEEEDSEFSGPSQLQRLEICGCEEMQSLPRWIQRLTCLETLKIGDCTSLEALPEWLPQLISLRNLDVGRCGQQLSERCRRGTGEDWRKISHIPIRNLE